MSTDDLHFRPATAEDLDRVLEINIAAFPDDRGVVERRRHFTANPLGALEDLVVAERGGDIVGQAFLYPAQAWFGGRRVRVGAIASLAVAPEARGRGTATALLGHLHVAADVRGDAFTMLYPFRQGFYSRLAYGPSTSRRRLAIAPASVPALWRALGRARVRRARGGDKEAIEAAYARAAAKASGWLARGEAFWAHHLSCERRQFLVAEHPASSGGAAQVAGYAAFELLRDDARGLVSLVVDEIAADDDPTRLALLGALAAMRDQATELVIDVDHGDPLELALVDPDVRGAGRRVERELGTIIGGPMLRIEDVSRAIEARGYAADGGFDVVVCAGPGEVVRATDEIAVSMRVDGGRAHVSAARGAAAALRITRAALASVFFGGLRPAHAVRLGLATADARTLARAEAVLALPPLASLDRF